MRQTSKAHIKFVPLLLWDLRYCPGGLQTKKLNHLKICLERCKIHVSGIRSRCKCRVDYLFIYNAACLLLGQQFADQASSSYIIYTTTSCFFFR
jgi:hypothetical protein